MCKNETLWKTAFLYETSVRSSNVECTNSQCIYRGSLAISLQSPLDNPSKRDVYFIDLGVSIFVKLLASFFVLFQFPPSSNVIQKGSFCPVVLQGSRKCPNTMSETKPLDPYEG